MTEPAPRVLFVGAVVEGHRCLEALIDAGERVDAIVSLDPALASVTSGWVSFDDLAGRLGVPNLTVRDLNRPESVVQVAALAPDLIVVIGWTRLLGPELLKIPRLGAVGFHASLLPRYRGRAPVNWALINGERETGNTMFFLDEGVDTGDVIDQRRIPITDDDDCATLYEKVAASGTAMLLEHLPALKDGRAPRISQDHSLATVMPKRRPEDGRIDWTKGRRRLFDWVRALTHPYPGAFSELDGRRLFVWSARPGSAAGPEPVSDTPPGIVVARPDGSVHVTTGDGTLELLRVQWQDGPEGDAAAILRSLDGSRFESGVAA